jgi:phospholipase A-2-activating protein
MTFLSFLTSVIYVWTKDGEQLLELHGHTNFVYGVATLPSGEIVSCGEDRCVKISIWSVSTQPNGDIVCGSSDGDVRVFTRSESRVASSTELNEFTEKVSHTAIAQESLGNINKEKLPHISSLSRTKGSHLLTC